MRPKSGSPAAFIALSLSCHNLASSRLLDHGQSTVGLSARISQSDEFLFDLHRLQVTGLPLCRVPAIRFISWGEAELQTETA